MTARRVLALIGIATSVACGGEATRSDTDLRSASNSSGTGGSTTGAAARATTAASERAGSPSSNETDAPRTAADNAPAQAGASAAADSGGAMTMTMTMPSPDSGSVATTDENKFSFFVTSLRGMLDLSGSEQGFGGDLRYGEATGLAGADKICTELAERSFPGAGSKGWRAFLSTAKGSPEGGPTHAKDRIGTGPWYDRAGRLVAMDLSGLLQQRPAGADSAIAADLPNERGEPNHTDTVAGMDDNHDVVTATNLQGMYDGRPTCEDFTSVETEMPMMMGAAGAGAAGRGGRPGRPGGGFMHYGPGVGHSWPAMSGMSWIAAHGAPGCSPSVALVQSGAGEGTGIGNGGGYGGIYCFALKP